MTSVKPYLIRAIYSWLVDNELSPHINVDTKSPKVLVPKEYVENDNITLDLSPDSVNELNMGDSVLTCQAVFDDKIIDLSIPVSSITTIYAEENNQGMSFPKEEFPDKDDEVSYTNEGSAGLKLEIIDGEKD